MNSSVSRSRLSRFGSAAICVLAVAAVVPAAVQAQRSDIPRLASGRPDLNGIWQALGNAHWDIEPHTARAALAMMEGPVIPVPRHEILAMGALGSVPSGVGIVVGGEIPYLPAALTLRNENRENYLDRDPQIKCYLPGVPRATYLPFPFQVFQSESKFFIAYEYAGAVRDVYLQDPGPAQVDTWMGQSVGTWEGDVFVVEATGFNGQAWLDRAGNHCDRALYDDQSGPHHVRGDAGGFEHVLASLDHQHASVPPYQRECATRSVQVCRVRRGVDVWAPSQEPHRPVGE